jgi:hypothetical protein
MNTFALILLAPFLFFTSFQSDRAFNNTPPSLVLPCDGTPALNNEIIKYVKTNISKKVGRGECWDLAAEALNTVGAKWDGDYGFGRVVNLGKECVYPGDVIQFTDVTVMYQKDNSIFTEQMQQHTAIIYTVKTPKEFVLADQNTNSSGRTVGLHPLELKNITAGTFKIYRPVK